MTRYNLFLIAITVFFWIGESFDSVFILGWFIHVSMLGIYILIFLFAYKGVFNVPNRDVDYQSLYSASSLFLLLVLVFSLALFNWIATVTSLVAFFSLFLVRTKC